MLTAQRKAHLLVRLAATGRLVARDEAQLLATSEDTIRRDLRDLAQAGKLLRVHGGALPLSPTHVPLARRRQMAPDEKRRLGAAAARLIRPGQTVILDGGTTHGELVRHLPADLAVTIVTHSPVLAAALEPFALIEVIMIGGHLYRHSMVSLGAVANEAFARIRADLCFLGVTGIHPEAGLTTGNHEEAQIKRCMIAQSGETLVLATQDKIATTSPFQIAALAEITTLITAGPRPDGLPDHVTHLQA